MRRQYIKIRSLLTFRTRCIVRARGHARIDCSLSSVRSFFPLLDGIFGSRALEKGETCRAKNTPRERNFSQFGVCLRFHLFSCDPIRSQEKKNKSRSKRRDDRFVCCFYSSFSRDNVNRFQLANSRQPSSPPIFPLLLY